MMSCWPVVLRELRAEARRPMNFWLRVGGASVFFAICFWTVWYAPHYISIRITSLWSSAADRHSDDALLGLRVFGHLSSLLFGLIWIVGPLLTTDCISREKREGTLGLLFLTSLSASGIVLGKTAVHLLRGVSLFLCVIPIMVVPLLLGGVTPGMCEIALLMNLGALLASMTAGLIATSAAKDWLRVVLWAELINFCFFRSFLHFHDFCVRSICPSYPDLPFGGSYYSDFGYRETYGYLGRVGQQFWLMNNYQLLSENSSTSASGYGGNTPFSIVFSSRPPLSGASLEEAYVITAIFLVCLSFAVFLFGLFAASKSIEASWQERGKPAWQEWWEKHFYSPRYWQKFLAARMSRSLDRNPIGWLHHYSASARMVKWLWALAIILIESVFVLDPNTSDVQSGQPWLIGLLMISLSFSAVSSFRRERESGAMELLLVSPLTVRQIIIGRMRGIWNQFLPATAVLIFALLSFVISWSWDADYYYHERQIAPSGFAMFLVVSFLSLPIIGMYFSLHKFNVLIAWLLTCLVGLATPWFFIGLVVNWFLPYVVSEALFLVVLVGVVLFALMSWRRLERNLRTRRFAIAGVTG